MIIIKYLINLFIKEGCDQMKAGIMQPTFLPWLGYFAMIDKEFSDLFIQMMYNQ